MEDFVDSLSLIEKISTLIEGLPFSNFWPVNCYCTIINRIVFLALR